VKQEPTKMFMTDNEFVTMQYENIQLMNRLSQLEIELKMLQQHTKNSFKFMLAASVLFAVLSILNLVQMVFTR
jgi:hypothetical protein